MCPFHKIVFFLVVISSGLWAESDASVERLVATSKADYGSSNAVGATKMDSARLRDLRFLNPPLSTDEQALIMAATDGRTDEVVRLLDLDVNPNITSARGSTPLILAAFFGHEDIVEILLNADADVDARDERDFTALHFAAQQGHTGVARMLVEHLANINIQNRVGATPLYIASVYGNLGVVEILVMQEGIEVETPVFSSGETSLIVAAGLANSGIVERLVDSGANVSARSQSMATALHRAGLALNNAITAEFLIEHEAEVDAFDENDDTPLEYAAYAGNVEVVEVLLRNEADPNLIDRQEKSIVEAVCQCKNAGPQSTKCPGDCDDFTNATITAMLLNLPLPEEPPEAKATEDTQEEVEDGGTSALPVRDEPIEKPDTGIPPRVDPTGSGSSLRPVILLTIAVCFIALLPHL